MLKRYPLPLLVGSAVLLAGCVTPLMNVMPTVGDDKLKERAAFTLGVSEADVTVSDVVKSGARTEFTAATRAGATRSCYVTSVAGSISVSDAICSGQPAVAAEVDRSVPAQECNALLEAAGEC